VVLEPGSTSGNGFDPLYGIYNFDQGGFYRTCDTCHDQIRNAANTIDEALLLAPNYFTSPRLGVSSIGPTSYSSTTAAPTPTLANYTQAMDNDLSPTALAKDSGNEVMAGQHEGGLDGSPMQRSVSDMSELGECPVCGTNLEDIPDKTEQEAHIQNCLESGTSSRVQDNRYLGEQHAVCNLYNSDGS